MSRDGITPVSHHPDVQRLRICHIRTLEQPVAFHPCNASCGLHGPDVSRGLLLRWKLFRIPSFVFQATHLVSNSDRAQ